MVTEKEQALVLTLCDMAQATIFMLNKSNKAQGIEEETQFVKDLREAMNNGFSVAYGTAEKRESPLLKGCPYPQYDKGR